MIIDISIISIIILEEICDESAQYSKLKTGFNGQNRIIRSNERAIKTIISELNKKAGWVHDADSISSDGGKRLHACEELFDLYSGQLLLRWGTGCIS